MVVLYGCALWLYSIVVLYSCALWLCFIVVVVVLQTASDWIVVHSLRSSTDEGILDPEDSVRDVADDREQVGLHVVSGVSLWE